MKKRVSIIIPTHNSEKFLKECVDSVLNQMSVDDEIILVENGSSDNTVEICRDYHKEHDSIKLIELGAVGVSVARNEGIKAAEGKWITFVDSDDKLLKGAFNVISNDDVDNADIVVAGYVRSLNSDNLRNDLHQVKPDILAKGVLQFAKYKKQIINNAPIDDFNNWASWGKFFNREFLLQNEIFFPAGVRLSEDAAFCFQAYCAAKNVFGAFQKIYFYRDNDESVVKTVNNEIVVKNNYCLMEFFEEYKRKYNVSKKFGKEYSAFMATKLISIYLSTNNKSIADILKNKLYTGYIKEAPVINLVNGIRNNLLYGRILLMMKLKLLF